TSNGRHMWIAMESEGLSHIGLKDPVGCPSAIIKRRNHRQPCVPAEDTGDLPAANDGVCGAAGTTREIATLPKRQLPNHVSVDAMPDVEIRAGIVVALPDRVNKK